MYIYIYVYHVCMYMYITAIKFPSPKIFNLCITVWHKLVTKILKVVSPTFLLVCFPCLKALRSKEKYFLFHFESSSCF